MPVSRVMSWNANTESDIAGYKLYAGTKTGVYDDTNSPKDMGNVTSGSFLPALDSTRFYALTAYDTDVLESGFSSEVEYLPKILWFG